MFNTDKWKKVTAPLGPWRLKNPREPKVQVGVGIKQTTICTAGGLVLLTKPAVTVWGYVGGYHRNGKRDNSERPV